MALASPPKPKYLTIADVLARVGDIPLDRILNHPEPGTATEQDVLDLDDHEDILCELVDGVLVRKPMGFEESTLAMVLGKFFLDYLETTPLGVIGGPDGMLRLAKGLVRIPDVSVVLWESIPGGDLTGQRIPNLAPDLAVEILSDSNTISEMDRKLKEYFTAGTRLAWIIDPETRTAKVYTSHERFELLTDADSFDGGDILPGLKIALRELFERGRIRRKP